MNNSLLGPEDIEKHAVEIAKGHIVGGKTRFPGWLVTRLSSSYKNILEVYKTINRETGGGLPLSPTDEWLLDNFYIIEEQVKDIKQNLFKKYCFQLPLLKNGQMKNYPRVYALALELVTHTDGSIDEKTLVNFTRAYQSRQPLAMGELWVMSAMLRIALIEKISHICHQLNTHYQQRHEAEHLADLIISAADKGDNEVQSILNEQMVNKAGVSPAFLEFLVQKLRKQGNKTAALIGYIDGQRAEQETSLEELINLEHQMQAARQVAMGNSITGLRMIAAIDWSEIFESLSQVEEILRRDPAGYYNQMDFESRDHYRHVIEKISSFFDISEINVAELALECAREATEYTNRDPISKTNRDPLRHVGYYLIDSGRKTLEKRIGVKSGGITAIFGFLKGYPYTVYFGCIAFITLAVTALFLRYAVNQGVLSPFLLFLIGLVLLIPVSDLAINTVNFAVSHIYAPTVLPKLELKEGISGENSAMVIIPTLLPNEKRVKELLEKLEIYYLANKEDNLYFALVGDFKDADSPEMADDPQIIDIALKGINDLNRRYSKAKTIFYYFHRERRYNPAQNQWMGWERKRGAIIELNDLLRGSENTGYKTLSSEISLIPAVKYIITLDADTNLPMGAAKKLIGTMDHPLNQPVIDWDRRIVVKGHGILQPRIGVSIDSANKTLFTRIFAGQGGIDPYTTAISDVYQDLFNEGIFTGKGIYELDTFQSLLKDTIPENSVLSHDLLEGSYLRAGLVTDIELIDGYPARYNSFSMRLHRWVRGDWQLTPWLAAMTKDRQGQWRKNPLNALSKWKIIDNLRRSLLNPALFSLIALGFAVLPGSSMVWLGLALVVIAFPAITYLAGGILAKRYPLMEGTRAQTVIAGVRASLYQAGLQFCFIAYQAYLMVDAIVRTLGRVLVTRKNLLEWIPAADLEALLKNDLPTFYKKMLVSPLLGLLVLGLAILRPNNGLELAMAAVVFGLWTGAPYAAYTVSQDYVQKVEQLTEQERLELRRLARKTWAYFEDLVTAEDNYLPPDNYQVDPPNGAAHRTSPTNIGLLLVSTLAARDFGYLGTAEMVERLNATLSTVEKMEKWEGHLYNWYDTVSLQVLRPRYVSTVDSGNLVGYLMTVEKGLAEYLNKPLSDLSLAEGLLDTVRIFNEELKQGLNDGQPAVDSLALEKYLAGGEYHAGNWLEVLDSMLAELSKDKQQARVQASPWGRKILAMVNSFKKEAAVSIEDIFAQGRDLLTRTRLLIENTKFIPLFDPKRQLFSIGYNVEEGKLTRAYYDLLASEARLASYIAVARGEIDKKHWFRLGRKLTRVDGCKGLVSWAGTMFEYFMPLLVMRNFENSLLDATYSFVVKAQKKYGQKRKIPWGVSESAYYAFDMALNYQYKAFGVPELGFKRGLGNELVVAPYATVLALTTDPKGVAGNIARLKAAGMDGDYGLYESIDYTPARAVLNCHNLIIKNFMVHHQGMIMLALNNYFNANIMQRRFHANPEIRSAEVLLQERMPFKVGIVKEHQEEYPPLKRKVEDGPEVIRKYGIPRSELPNVHLLSNGSYSVMVTDGGAGYSKNNDMAVARWRESRPGKSPGFFIYVQNINSNNVWSATYEPYNLELEEYRVVFSPDKAEFVRKDGNIETHTQIAVSPEDNAEVRKITLTNNSRHSRVLEVTSYLEAVLTHPDADLAHPAFSNLFVTTEFVPEYDCLLAVRRPRSAGQKPVWAVHTVTVEGEVIGDLQYETDRAKFIGRNRGLANPLAMDVDQPLSNSAGAVLDPVMSLRRRVKLEPGHSAIIAYTLAAADNRQNALILADKYRDPKVIERAFEFAWNRSRIEAGYLDIQAGEMELYLNMVPSIIYPGPVRRRYEGIIARNKKGQPGLWPSGISGDIPIVLVHVTNKEQMEMVCKLLKAHEFWRMKGLKVDLVFLAEDESGYVQPLQDGIRAAIFASHARDMVNRTGGVYLLNANLMTEEEKILMYAAARIILKGDAGPVEEQLVWEQTKETVPGLSTVNVAGGKTGKQVAGGETGKEVNRGETHEEADQQAAGKEIEVPASSQINFSQLLFYNGTGGFSQDGREYLLHLREGQHTPAPWINVIANTGFGFNITEVGSGYTWAENSRENKLTPWYNDPVTDLPGEVLYLRDEQTGDYWSITPMPVREKEDYIIRHGKGYSSFEHTSHGIEQQLTEFVALEDPVKIYLIRLKNLSRVPREIAVTYYMRPVLGVNEQVNAQYITTRSYGEQGVLLISNSYNSDFPGRIAFVDTSEATRTFSGDGNEFLGINGDLERPAALERERLSGTVGAGLAPCGAIQVKLSLEPEESKEIVFLLGQGRDLSEVLSIRDKYTKVTAAREELARVKAFWTEKLEVIQVSTPDRSMDILLNSWLQYQVISCRLWSRAAFYQSGGAYGFRDQLQDVMAVAYTWPELTRKQILLHAAHQFVEGDVQHWWHPGSGVDKGIRTRYSDDFLWLPYVTADYVQCTGDWSVLDEVINFLEDDPLPADEDERYNIPRISQEKDTIYNHCIRAIENALKFGLHGLPLMGSGDWNDGMNTVGNKGKGESVWLGWFLYTVLQRFIPVCTSRNDQQRAEQFSLIAAELAGAIEKNAWDGSWYRRAYFDDGTPLGSAANSECKIDAIAQSWSVISGIGKPRRAEEAMQAVENYLVDREAGIIKLLTPPFGDGQLQPGYIKGYVPGVRENGGQYTHAAVWTILAFAKLGMGDKVWELFHLINPINHARTPMEAIRYKVEPYVLAADVYAVHPNTGRGGWSWYTGAAGWMYRVGIEHVLGIKKVGTSLHFDPCIPKDWPGFEVRYRLPKTLYRIHVQNPERVNKGVKKVIINGKEVPEGYVSLVDDGREYRVEVVMG
ncbi:MAG: glycosyl transferase [Clostridia bacterium]|nr:glycosyl transferase [Clostridia bacterium]